MKLQITILVCFLICGSLLIGGVITKHYDAMIMGIIGTPITFWVLKNTDFSKQPSQTGVNH